MALSEIDRSLLERCLERKPRAWEDFVDRFMGLVVHVVTHTARARSVRLSTADQEDLCAEVFLAILKNDFSVLRNFRGKCSLATYLTVVARRIVVREFLSRMSSSQLVDRGSAHMPESVPDPHLSAADRLANHEEVEQLLTALSGSEAQVVRMYHLEGRTYHEISTATGVPENSIGSILSRARVKMRHVGVNTNAG